MQQLLITTTDSGKQIVIGMTNSGRKVTLSNEDTAALVDAFEKLVDEMESSDVAEAYAAAEQAQARAQAAQAQVQQVQVEKEAAEQAAQDAQAEALEAQRRADDAKSLALEAEEKAQAHKDFIKSRYREYSATSAVPGAFMWHKDWDCVVKINDAYEPEVAYPIPGAAANPEDVIKP